MSIEDVIQRTGDTPITIERLVRDLRALGVESGMTLLVHSSLSQIGYVCGGAMAVVLALQEALGDEGTLVMPTMSGEWSDPARWENPAVPEAWWQVIREHWPAWDPDMAQTYRMGAVAETFRSQRDAIRSGHPAYSFTARGPDARYLTDEHMLATELGERSPLGRLYELNGHVLLIGVDHANNSSIHLAEHRIAEVHYRGKTIGQGAAMKVDGKRSWIEYGQLQHHDADLGQLGRAFEAQTDHVTLGPVGLAESRLMRQRPLVDFAVNWMNEHR